ncbi:MAG: hypothetical protein ACYTG1_09040 [Planctomycetota bacterium]|jgi:predicted ATPase
MLTTSCPAATASGPRATSRTGSRRRWRRRVGGLSGDQRYDLARSPIRSVPLTATRATRVNSALRLGGDPAADVERLERRLDGAGGRAAP